MSSGQVPAHEGRRVQVVAEDLGDEPATGGSRGAVAHRKAEHRRARGRRSVAGVVGPRGSQGAADGQSTRSGDGARALVERAGCTSSTAPLVLRRGTRPAGPGSMHSASAPAAGRQPAAQVSVLTPPSTHLVREVAAQVHADVPSRSPGRQRRGERRHRACRRRGAHRRQGRPRPDAASRHVRTGVGPRPRIRGRPGPIALPPADAPPLAPPPRRHRGRHPGRRGPGRRAHSPGPTPAPAGRRGSGRGAGSSVSALISP